MALLDDGLTAGTTCAASATSGVTGVSDSGAGITCNVSTKSTANDDGGARVESTGEGITSDTCTSTATDAMVATTTAGAALTMGTASPGDKTNETHATIILPLLMANLSKKLNKTKIDYQ